MSDSYISVGPGGTCFSGPDGTRLFKAMTIKSGIRLLAVGIRPSAGWTMTKALKAASDITKKPYKRAQWPQACTDLQLWIDTMRAALPVVEA